MTLNKVIERCLDISILPIIVSIIILHYLVGGIPLLPSISLVAVYSFTAFLYFTTDKFKIKPLWLIFILYIPFTIIIGNPDPVFKSWERYLLYACLLLAFSPIIQSKFAIQFRWQCYYSSIIICIVLTIGSFIGYFFGINLFSYELAQDYVGKAGLFSGLTRQSMLLGPISGISIIFLLYQCLTKRKLLFWILVIPACGSLLFASSRIAFGATIVGVSVVLYYTAPNVKSLAKRIIVILLVICFTFPLWKNTTTAMQQKIENHSNSTALFDSRANKIEARIDEFWQNPLTGIGFAAFDPNGKDSYNRITGTIEPGSSWLAILSMTGSIGCLFVLLFILSGIKAIIKTNNDLWLLGVLSFFCIHMLAEGYVYAAGSPTAFLLWCTIGCAYDTKYRNSILN